MKMFKDYRKRRKLFVMFLIYLLLVSSYFSLHTFSKYVSVTNDKTGTKGIARWNIELDTSSSSNVLNLVSGNDTNEQTYLLTITSTSEVKASCSLEITNIPTGVQVKLDNEQPVTEVNNVVNIYDFCTFNANDQNNSRSYILKFIAPLNVNPISNQSIGIDVTCRQTSF